MKFHKHKWQYLSKEHTTETEEKSYHMGYISMGSSRETVEREVTHIKRFCKRCGEINVQTVPGKLLTKDLKTMGYYDPTERSESE
jgi:hypothetical protein